MALASIFLFLFEINRVNLSAVPSVHSETGLAFTKYDHYEY